MELLQYGDITFGGCVHLHSLCNWKTVLSAGHMAQLRGATLRTPQPSGQMAAEYGVWTDL